MRKGRAIAIVTSLAAITAGGFILWQRLHSAPPPPPPDPAPASVPTATAHSPLPRSTPQDSPSPAPDTAPPTPGIGPRSTRQPANPAASTNPAPDAAVHQETGTPPAGAAATVAREPNADSLLDRFRTEKNAILRRELMKTWADNKEPGVAAVADGAIADPDPTVIIQAVNIIGALKRRESSPALLQVIAGNRRRPDGYGPAICEAAVQALGQCGDADAASFLIAELTAVHDLSYHNVVVEALGLIGNPSAARAVDKHIERLESRRPTEPIALGPWREALDIARKAQERLR